MSRCRCKREAEFVFFGFCLFSDFKNVPLCVTVVSVMTLFHCETATSHLNVKLQNSPSDCCTGLFTPFTEMNKYSVFHNFCFKKKLNDLLRI